MHAHYGEDREGPIGHYLSCSQSGNGCTQSVRKKEIDAMMMKRRMIGLLVKRGEDEGI